MDTRIPIFILFLHNEKLFNKIINKTIRLIDFFLLVRVSFTIGFFDTAESEKGIKRTRKHFPISRRLKNHHPIYFV